jgi:hypothetical protein
VPQKMTLILKIFSTKNILAKSPYYEKEKKKRKRKYHAFFHNLLNPTQEITPLKEKFLTPLNTT